MTLRARLPVVYLPLDRVRSRTFCVQYIQDTGQNDFVKTTTTITNKQAWNRASCTEQEAGTGDSTTIVILAIFQVGLFQGCSYSFASSGCWVSMSQSSGCSNSSSGNSNVQRAARHDLNCSEKLQGNCFVFVTCTRWWHWALCVGRRTICATAALCWEVLSPTSILTMQATKNIAKS